MITHKIRIYPNVKMKNFLDSQFEFSRRDYNRQLKMIVDGIREKRIHEGNFVQALERIKLHAIKSVQSMGGSLISPISQPETPNAWSLWQKLFCAPAFFHLLGNRNVEAIFYI